MKISITVKLIFLLTFCPLCFISAQEFIPDYISYYDQVIPGTPNAQSFTVYGDTPVDFATGIPQINIPLFTIVEDGVSVPISLSYHPSGVKVDELASVVGLKWTLNAGGGIFRTVNDKIDEIGWLDPNQRGIVNPTWIDNNSQENLLTLNNWISASDSQHDYYPDDFNFNFVGNSGNFIFDLNGAVATESRTALKIEKTMVGQIIDFTASDSNGNDYSFNQTKEFNSQNVYVGSATLGSLSLDRSSYSASWLLDQITTRNNKQISFTYLPYSLNYTINGVSHAITYTPECPTPERLPCGCEGNGQGVNTEIVTTSINYMPSNKLINTIETSNVKVTFSYLDDTSLSTWKKKLTSISILDKIKNKTKSFTFNYGKFSGDPRLRLEAVQEVGFDGSKNPAYKFYYESGNLPTKGSKSKDYHGYYNGKINSTLVPYSSTADNTINNTYSSQLADRTEDINYLKIGTLNKIEYPTGGSTSFNYEANAVPASNNVNPTYSTKNVSISNQSYSSKFTSGGNTIFRIPFTIQNSTGTVQVNYNGSSDICSYDPNYPNIDCSKFNIYNRNGRLVVGNPIFNPDKIVWANGSVSLPGGDYMLELKVETTDLNSNPNALIQENLSWLEQDQTSSQTKYTGGLRVKSIIDQDDSGELLKQTNYSYDGLVGYSLDVSSTIKSYGSKKVFSAENLNLNSSLIKNGYFYESVIIEKIGSSENIKTEIQYQEQPRNKNYGFRQIKEDLFNETDIVRTTTFEYDNTLDSTTQFWTLGDKDDCFSYQGKTYLGYAPPNSSNYYHRRNTLSEKTVIDYFDDPNQTFSASLTINRYQYNDYMQMISEELDGRYYAQNELDMNNGTYSFNANGKYLSIQYTYPNDHASQDAVMSILVNKNQVSLPVSKKIYNNSNLILGQINEFDSYGNIKKVYRYNKGEESNTSNLNYIPSNYGLSDKFIIEQGRLIESIQNEGPPKVILWGYGGQYPIAEITNTSYAEIENELVPASGILIDINETNMTAINALRGALPKAMITTYTYEPLVGVKTITDPKGYIINYSYDTFNRLQFIKDANGKILNEYKYNYKSN